MLEVRRDPGWNRLHEPKALPKWRKGQNCCEANLGYSLCDLKGQGSVHGIFREDEDAIPIMEKTFEYQRLCILIGDRSILILRRNDIKVF